jgi:AraC-like DNA-binding protein
MTANSDNLLPHLGFQRFTPSTKLAPYIQCYWFIKSRTEQNVKTTEYQHADGGMSITFNYSDNLWLDNDTHAGHCLIDGAQTKTRAIHFDGQFNAIGIRFLPAGARAFLAMPLHEIRNHLIPTGDIPISGLHTLYERLGETVSIIDKVAHIEGWLLSIIQPEQRAGKIVDASLQFLNQHHGDINVAAMATHFDINKRTLERLFNNQVGLSPKEYARNRRISQARFYLKQHPEWSLANVALQLGFYDQAHFSNQFKQVVGLSPKIYAAKSQLVA